MRLFLSYGRDEHVDFAVRLKADLERCGHSVWFDTEQLTPGYNWEWKIEVALDQLSAENGQFLLLITPYSVRRPHGYCLNELARAFSRGLTVIPLMVATVEPPLSICRIQWLDFRTRYEDNFKKLVDAIDHDGLKFEGTQARLSAVLKPIEYDEPSRHLRRFTGREWVELEVERWLANASRRVLWIKGKAGIGKSAVAAWMSQRRREIAGAHYCRYGNADRNARRALLSLAWQLSTQLSDYEARLNASALEEVAAESNLEALFEPRSRA